MCDLTAPYFQDKDKAREHLESLRWPNGPFCPHCGASDKPPMKLKGEKCRTGLYKCSEYQCRKQFTVTVGTVFERSKVPLNKWLMAVHLMCASKKGMSAHQIHRMIGVTYKTAWFMCHRIREAMQDDGFPLGGNGGTVEADETFWGNNKPKGQKKGRGYHHKMKVLSLIDRSGRKRSFKVEHVNANTLKPYLEQHIHADTNLMTDEASAYTLIGRSFMTHGIVRHSQGQYADGKINTNSAESSFSLLKRGLRGIFHHVGEQHLQRYVTEFDFRWNFRLKNGFDDKERADVLLSQIGGRRLLYRDSLAV